MKKSKRKLKKELRLIKKQNNQIVYFTVMIKPIKKIKKDNIKNRISISKKVMLIYQYQKNVCYNYPLKVLRNFNRNYCMQILQFVHLLKQLKIIIKKEMK